MKFSQKAGTEVRFEITAAVWELQGFNRHQVEIFSYKKKFHTKILQICIGLKKNQKK